MNRIAAYLVVTLALLLAVGLAACTDEPLDPPARPGHAVFNPDGTLGVTIGLDISGLNAAATRAELAEKPAYDELKLYLLLFEEGEGLKQYAALEPAFRQTDSDHSHHELMTFDVSLEPTEKNATIHLIATNQPDFSKQILFGIEKRVVPSLYTDENHEAYWQRIELGSNVPSAEKAQQSDGDAYDPNEAAKADAIAAALSHVPMIRNFCRVSVDVGLPGNFTLTGLYVVNTVDRGSVAPYVAASGKFVDYYDTATSGKSYAEISAQNYIGTLPAGVKLINTALDPAQIATKAENPSGFSDPSEAAVYFYERPARVNSTERTYVILRGNATIEDNTGEKKTYNDRFYKLDLGYIGDTESDRPIGLFDYYNLLRNFDYRIRISEVADAGYESLETAAKGAVYNNFSASVEARNMKSISDGTDMIFVNFTSYVFTQAGQSVDLLAQYRTDITQGGGKERNDLLWYRVEPAVPGDVIAGIKEVREHHDNDLTAWNTYTVSTGDITPTDQLRQQTVYIYRGNRADAGEPADYGLYRVVTFFSHSPWTFKHIDTFSGLWESVTDIPSWDEEGEGNWSTGKREIGQSKGSPLTLFFELPAGLPQALFPLEFVIESDRQNIQNAYQGNAVVRSVPARESLFYTDWTITQPTTTRIQYVKTVTWEDYFGELSEELVGNGTSIVRCRFLTITDLAQDGIGGSGSNSSSETTLRVANPYFGQLDKTGRWLMYHQDGFTRNTTTSDPSPRFWDFTSAYWDEIMTAMNQTNRDSYTATTGVKAVGADELVFIDGGTRTLRNLTDGNGYRYVQTANAGDALLHIHTYDASQSRTIHLEIVSTDTSGKPLAPDFTITAKGGVYNTLTAVADTPATGTWSKDANYTTYLYNIAVPKEVTEVTIKIRRNNNTDMRFYAVDFYPRWDEYEQTN